MLVERVAEDDVERGEAAGQEGEREPDAERDQDGEHGDEGDAVLKDAAEIFEESDGAVAGLGAGAVEVIVEISVVVEGEVHGEGLAVDEGTDAILYEICLGGANPGGGDAGALGEEEEGDYEGGEQQSGARGGDRVGGADGSDEGIDQGPRQVDGADGKEALEDEENYPKGGMARGGGPHQSEGLREVGELGRELAEFSAEDGEGRSRPEAHGNMRRKGQAGESGRGSGRGSVGIRAGVRKWD